MPRQRVPRRIQPILTGLVPVPKAKRRGRPPKDNAGVPHLRRAPFDPRQPIHVTWKMDEAVTSLRRLPVFHAIEQAMVGGRERLGVRLVHFSVQDTHIHLIVEAAGLGALARGLKGLGIRIARSVNRTLGRTGQVVIDRYHMHVLTDPLQVRNAIRYVLQNFRKHIGSFSTRGPWAGTDPMSSGRYFDGWRDGVVVTIPAPSPPPVVGAATWLLSVGWRRFGLIGIQELPSR